MYIEAFKEKSQLNMDENIVWMFLSSSVYIKVEIRSNNSPEFKSLGNCIEIYAIYTIYIAFIKFSV